MRRTFNASVNKKFNPNEPQPWLIDIPLNGDHPATGERFTRNSRLNSLIVNDAERVHYRKWFIKKHGQECFDLLENFQTRKDPWRIWPS